LTLEGAGVRELDQISQRTMFFIDEIDALQDRLSKVAMELESESERLLGNIQRWRMTKEQGTGDKAMESRVLRIERTIHRMDSVRNLLQEDLVLILEGQDKLADKKAALEEVVSRVKDQKVMFGETMLTRDMSGFFKDLTNLRDSTLIRSHMKEFNGSIKDDLDLLKSSYSRPMIVAMLMLLALLAFSVWFKKNHTRLISEEHFELSTLHMTIIHSPVVTSLFVVALMIRMLIPDLPQAFYALNLLIMMVPMAILVIRIYGSVFRIWIIVLVVVTSLLILYELSYHPGILLRIMLLGLCLAGLWLFTWVYTRRPFFKLLKNKLIYRFFRLLLVVFMVLHFTAIIANLVGAVRLAEFFTLLPIQITILAIGIQVSTKIAAAIVYLALSSNSLQKANVIRDEFQVICRKSIWLIDLFLLLIFFTIALRILRVKDIVFDWGRGVLTDGIKIGAVEITLGNILIFVFVIWLSIMITRIISHILEKDLFTRVTTAKGMPSTVILLVKIVLISGGFFLAAAASGMQLTNLSIVLGAFSVGIGFGLQNIFNNMVSGLILAFERPIKVGDVVQVGELMGTVRSIGLRSSTVKGFDGAEVIVPNGNLISNEMINWTLSDSNRRMDIRVGVAYGTDPEAVLALMEETATEHTGVRKKPEPKAYFIDFGDSSLNFRLLAWAHLDIRMGVESDLKVTINRKLKEANIEIPFPQTDLHIRSDDTKPKK
ncbi:MAG: mechanosensitive ion channel, partial [Bacteroidales bacterium]|nr:mechanosensitive ion channel [Bacteroidales bacterium]